MDKISENINNLGNEIIDLLNKHGHENNDELESAAIDSAHMTAVVTVLGRLIWKHPDHAMGSIDLIVKALKIHPDSKVK